MTTLAFALGASRAAGARRPSWIPSDYAAAARLWVQSVLVWIAVAVPVLMIVAGVQEAFWLAVVVPVWGATAAIYSFSLGHLGAVSLAGENLTVWDLDAIWTVLVILAALALDAR